MEGTWDSSLCVELSLVTESFLHVEALRLIDHKGIFQLRFQAGTFNSSSILSQCEVEISIKAVSTRQ